MQVLLFWSNFGHRDTDRLLIYLRLHDEFAAGRRHSFDFDSQRLRGDVVGEGFERGKDELLLFDLHTDPHEMNNLAEQPAQAKEIERLSALMEKWMDPWPPGLPEAFLKRGFVATVPPASFTSGISMAFQVPAFPLADQNTPPLRS